MPTVSLTMNGANGKAHDWSHISTPFTEVTTLLNSTKLDYLNVQTNGLRATQMRSHAGVVVGQCKVRNDSGVAFVEGSLIYITGTYTDGTDTYPTAALADSKTGTTSFYATLVSTEAVADDADGTAALVYELRSQDTSGGTIGDRVYLSSTAGGWTRTVPSGNSGIQIVGQIGTVHASTGTVLLKPETIQTFEDLTYDQNLTVSGTLTSTGAATLASLTCTAGATFGGGYGSTGATISTAGVIQANGAITSDGAVTGATLVGTVSTATQNSITTATSLTSVGTIGTGIWRGTKVESAYLDDDTAHLSGTQTFSGAKTFGSADLFVANGNGMVIGHTAQTTVTGVTPEFQMLGTGFADSFLCVGRWSADASPPFIGAVKSRHATIGSSAIVQNGDGVLDIVGYIDDGADVASDVARIRFIVDDATPAENQTGGAILFNTTTVTGATATEALRIDSAQKIYNRVDNTGYYTGGGDDVRLWFNGTHTYLDMADGAGSIYLRSGSDIRLTNHDGTKTYAQFAEDGASTLYHNEVVKFATTATGASITGTAAGLNLLVSDAAAVTYTANTIGAFQNTSAGTGAISRVAIVGGTAGYSVLDFGDSGASNAGGLTYNHSTNALAIATGGSGATMMTINSTGNVGIGASAHATNRLYVQHSITAGALNTAPVMRIKNGAGSGNYVAMHFGGAVSDGFIGFLDHSTASSRMLSFAPDGAASAMQIKSGGAIKNPVDNAGFHTGAADDLRMYHDGSNSYLSSDGTGALIMKDDTNVQVWGDTINLVNAAGAENYLVGVNGGAVSLYHNNVERFKTTAGGVQLPTAGDYVQFTGGSSSAWGIGSTGGNATPGTAGTTLGFHHWSGSAWTNSVNIDSAGMVGINETVNSKMTIGLTINQAANYNEAQAWQSSEVTHGVTDVADTNTYGAIWRVGTADGGVQLKGFTEVTQAVETWGVSTTGNTTHTAAGRATIGMWALKKSGTSVTGPAANENMFAVYDGGVGAAFIVDKEGDLFANGSATTVYDDHDDVALLSAFDATIDPSIMKRKLQADWEDFESYNEQSLIDLGIFGGKRNNVDPSQRGLINYTGLSRLTVSAVRQVGRAQAQMQAQLDAKESRIAALESQIKGLLN